ncbi:nucleoside hydrolase [Agromyces larvae]|uniref:Nucleoside hydrolase n=1 Tax=Agromyces larvae TaxID=2929802 RepID=A0ABY4C1U2_9MICO|nr:nucleoside hydrolase [Agromyces larvae]UOE44116.1 nucleoside hydrolase [Agromyces larvae]
MPHATAPIPVYLDCDTGIDDAVALAYLIAHPGVRLVGIGTVSGNTTAEQAARNTLGLLAAAGVDDVPVAVGAHDFLQRPFGSVAADVHGGDGVGGVADSLPAPRREVEPGGAVDLLLRLSREYAGELRVLAVGPLTNLVLALRADAGLPGRVHSVTVMGGAVDAPGNVSLVAEANFRNDPAAAAEALVADWPVTLVPLDVTMSHTLDEAGRQALLHHDGTVPRLLGGMLDTYLGFYVEVYGDRRCALHDPLAAAVASGDIGTAEVRRGVFDVVRDDGPEHGRVIELEDDGSAGRAGAVMSTDAQVAELVLGRILGHDWPSEPVR